MANSQCEKADRFITECRHKVNNRYRLKYHLMGECGWINDPNGFIEFKNSYHVFYQYYPYEPFWGPMHWGHAKSEDLVKWKQLPVALAPECDFDKDGCFSGSAIEKDGRLYLMYTGNVNAGSNKDTESKQIQCLAFSDDAGVFKKFKHNPVIDIGGIPDHSSRKDFRDPRVFKRGNAYYAVLGSNDGNGSGQVLLYQSLDLFGWRFINILAKSDGNMGNTWECPDLFNIQGMDILIVSPQYLKPQGNNYHNLHSSIYMPGNLDIAEGTFKFEKYYPVDYGFDFYAPQTISDSKGRKIMIAWMDMWEAEYPTQILGHNWAGAMTLPREIILKGGRLYFRPIDEIRKYRSNGISFSDISLNGVKKFNTYSDCYEIQVVFAAEDAAEFGLKLNVNDMEETILAYDREDGLFRFNRDKSGIGPKGERRTEIDLLDNTLKLHIFVDKCSVEVFINDGEKVMTGRIYPSMHSPEILFFSKGKCRILLFEKWDIMVD